VQTGIFLTDVEKGEEHSGKDSTITTEVVQHCFAKVYYVLC